MEKSHTSQIIQGKATFRKGINDQLIGSTEIRAKLDQYWWSISNLSIIEDY
jgi:hypothetical protein